MIQKIISGGQTGVDQAALRAAKRLGISTGGWAPRNWQTLEGPMSQLADYGLVESAGAYAWRTEQNVRDSDATIRIARDFLTTGERCTLRAILKHKKPHKDFTVIGNLCCLVTGSSALVDPATVLLGWCVENEIHVLNVAGNSERTAPGIGAIAEQFLFEVLSKVA